MRLGSAGGRGDRPAQRGVERSRPGKPSFLADLWSVAIRALRALPREPEVMIPSLIIPVFFFAVNIGTLQDFAERGIPGLDFRAFQLPTAIVFAVTGISRAHALVTDIQSGYFDRMLMTPMRRLSLLLGLMVADLVLVMALSLPVIVLGLAVGVALRDRHPRAAPLHRPDRVLGAGLHRLPVRHRAQDRVAGRGRRQLHPLLPVRLPDHGDAAAGGADRLAGHHRHLQPDDLPAGRAALAALRRLATADRCWRASLAIPAVGVVSMGLALATLRGRVARG